MINSDSAIDAGVDIMLIVFEVLSSPILIVVRVLRYGFNKFIRGYVIRGIKWILNKLLGKQIPGPCIIVQKLYGLLLDLLQAF